MRHSFRTPLVSRWIDSSQIPDSQGDCDHPCGSWKIGKMVSQRGRKSIRNTLLCVWPSMIPLWPKAELFLDFSGSHSLVFGLPNLFVSSFNSCPFLVPFLFGLAALPENGKRRRVCQKVPSGRPGKS